ncbi:MAG: hypothetical protein K2J42_05325 [Muribaculaceae bacterium]|nr:hypothetical protein [Muribaculaceae bacterium]
MENNIKETAGTAVGNGGFISSITRYIPQGVPCLVIVVGLFWYIGHHMGVPNMLNNIIHTSHELLHNTVLTLWVTE